MNRVLFLNIVCLACQYAHAQESILLPQGTKSKNVAAEDPKPKDSQQPVFSGRFVDLTHPFNEQTIYWPTENGFRLERGPAGVTERGYFYSANRFAAAEHGGTHVDSPIHFSAQGNTVDQIALERLIHEAVVVDVAQACAANADYQ